jgi:hypothetical protein
MTRLAAVASLSTDQRDVEDLMLVTAYALNRAQPDSELELAAKRLRASIAKRLRASIARQALTQPTGSEEG